MAMLTGSIMMVLSQGKTDRAWGSHLFIRMALFPEGSPFLPQSYQFCTLKPLEFHAGFNKQHQCIGQMKFSLCFIGVIIFAFQVFKQGLRLPDLV